MSNLLSVIVFVLSLLPPIVAASSVPEPLKKEFEQADLKHDVNQALLRAIGKHESGLNSLIVGFVVKDPGIAAAAEADLRSSPVKFKKSTYKKWWHFSLTFKDAAQAKQALPWLEKVTAASTGYDVGIMQINSRNAHRNGWDIPRLLTDPGYNIDKGAAILSDCRTLFKSDAPKAIECYNKGTKSSNFDYRYYSSIYAQYYVRTAEAKQKPVLQKKADVAQAKKEFVLPRDYGSGRTLF